MIGHGIGDDRSGLGVGLKRTETVLEKIKKKKKIDALFTEFGIEVWMTLIIGAC